MAEYIERGKAENDLDEWIDMYPDSDTAREALTLAKRSIEKLPAADVRPVVTCGECDNWQTDWQPSDCKEGIHFCAIIGLCKPADYFCADGKREES